MARERLCNRVQKWWDGEFVIDDDPPLLFFYTNRHWTSKLAHSVVDGVAKQGWSYWLTVALMLCGIIVSALV